MKTRSFWMLLLAFLMTLALCACGAQPAEPTEEVKEETVSQPAEESLPQEENAAAVTEDEAVARAVLDRAESGYSTGECSAEGHIILRVVPEGDTVVVYAQCSTGNYGFVNGNFEEVSGSGAIPSRLTFTRDSEGGFTLTEYWEPEDGNRYAASIKENFPADLVTRAMDTDYPALQAQKETYAKAYLEEIGREAEVGEFADFEHPLATDQGMSVEVSNALLGTEELQSYPFFLGEEERIEDGVRWVYSNEWEPSEDGGTATYTKKNYDTGEIAEQHVYQVTGDTFEEV